MSLQSKYLKAYDKISDEFMLKDFKPEEKDYDSLVKSDLNSIPEKNFFEMSLPEFEDSIDKKDLKVLFNFLEDYDMDNVKDGSILEDSNLKILMQSVTGKQYLYDTETYKKDVLFFISLNLDLVGKGIVSSERIKNFFKIYHDMYSDDLNGGNMFYEKFRENLKVLKR